MTLRFVFNQGIKRVSKVRFLIGFADLCRHCVLKQARCPAAAASVALALQRADFAEFITGVYYLEDCLYIMAMDVDEASRFYCEVMARCLDPVPTGGQSPVMHESAFMEPDFFEVRADGQVTRVEPEDPYSDPAPNGGQTPSLPEVSPRRSGPGTGGQAPAPEIRPPAPSRPTPPLLPHAVLVGGQPPESAAPVGGQTPAGPGPWLRIQHGADTSRRSDPGLPAIEMARIVGGQTPACRVRLLSVRANFSLRADGGRAWLAVAVDELEHGGVIYAELDAHITLCYLWGAAGAQVGELARRVDERLGTLAAKRHVDHFCGNIVGPHELSGPDYAWGDIVVHSNLHSTLHNCMGYIRNFVTDKSGFSEKDAFHLSFRTPKAARR